MIDENNEIQKLIFKKNNELVLSKNGQAKIGKWEYFPKANSLLIDRVSDQLLCTAAFIDQGVIILRQDGTDNNFFPFVNENIVPNLNVFEYLNNLRIKKLRIMETKLSNGRVLEIHQYNESLEGSIGRPVTENSEEIEDGIFMLENKKKYIEIKKGQILKLLTEISYTNPTGQIITIQHQNPKYNFEGDYVYLSGNKIENGIVDFSKHKNIIVKNGSFLKFEYKNKFLKWVPI